MKKMPVIFFGHGSPMNAIRQNPFVNFLSGAGKEIPKPKAILCISAHWETIGTKILKILHPRTLHDFYGFPQALFEVQYPAPGSPAIADEIIQLLQPITIDSDTNWGLDHGCWSILKHLYPLADIPVIQLSLNKKLSLPEHYAMGIKLKSLRNQNILIIGSGNITHNLRNLNWNINPTSFDWAIEFDEMIKKAIVNQDLPTLFGQNITDKKLWQMAHPTFEHYMPLLYVLGASDPEDMLSFPYEGMELGSLSMRAVQFIS